MITVITDRMDGPRHRNENTPKISTSFSPCRVATCVCDVREGGGGKKRTRTTPLTLCGSLLNKRSAPSSLYCGGCGGARLEINPYIDGSFARAHLSEARVTTDRFRECGIKKKSKAVSTLKVCPAIARTLNSETRTLFTIFRKKISATVCI